MSPIGPARKRTLWILALLVALALGMRLASAGRLLPHFREPDAFEVYEMQRAQGDPALVRNVLFHERYPWFLAWTLAALPPARAPAHARAVEAEELHLAAASEPFLRVRTVVALLATLQVLLTFFLARRFLPEGQALAAVFLVATSLLQLLFSVQARPHGANAGLALLALIAALQLVERFAFGRLALAIVTSAAAVATFQLGLATLPPLFAACLLLPGRSLGQRLALAALAPLAALALALPWYTNPPYIDATGVHLASADAGGHSLDFHDMDLLGAWRGARMLFEHDPSLALLAGAGIVLALARARASWKAAGAQTRRALALAGAFAIPYALVITIQGEVHERFLMPLLPFLALFGAASLAWLWRMPRARWATALLFLAPPALSAAQFVHLALVPDAFEQAADWVRRNVGSEEKVVLFPDNSLPLLYSRDSIASQLQDTAARNMPWVTYQATIPALPEGTRTWNVHCFPVRIAESNSEPSVDWLRQWLTDERADYLVVEYSQRMWRTPVLPGLEQAAISPGQVVFRSVGTPPDVMSAGWTYQELEQYAWRQIRQGALGPEIRIVKITRP